MHVPRVQPENAERRLLRRGRRHLRPSGAGRGHRATRLEGGMASALSQPWGTPPAANSSSKEEVGRTPSPLLRGLVGGAGGPGSGLGGGGGAEVTVLSSVPARPPPLPPASMEEEEPVLRRGRPDPHCLPGGVPRPPRVQRGFNGGSTSPCRTRRSSRTRDHGLGGPHQARAAPASESSMRSPRRSPRPPAIGRGAGARTFFLATASSPETMHSLRPVPRMIASYSSSIAPPPAPSAAPKGRAVQPTARANFCLEEGGLLPTVCTGERHGRVAARGCCRCLLLVLVLLVVLVVLVLLLPVVVLVVLLLIVLLLHVVVLVLLLLPGRLLSIRTTDGGRRGTSGAEWPARNWSFPIGRDLIPLEPPRSAAPTQNAEAGGAARPWPPRGPGARGGWCCRGRRWGSCP